VLGVVVVDGVVVVVEGIVVCVFVVVVGAAELLPIAATAAPPPAAKTPPATSATRSLFAEKIATSFRQPRLSKQPDLRPKWESAKSLM
jgi:hypothetical protein